MNPIPLYTQETHYYSTDHYDVGRVNANTDKIDTAIGNYTGSAPDTYSTATDGDKSLSNYIKFIWAKLKQAISDLANLTKNFDSFKSETQTSLSNKASLSVASTTYNGLMSSGDKTKLDNINVNSSNLASVFTSDNNFVTTRLNDTYNLIIGVNGNIALYDNIQKKYISAWNTATIPLVTSGASGLMSNLDKSKLDGINISNYYNKSESDNRYALKLVVSNVANGLMSAIDKAKLDNIDINNYYNKSEVAQALSLKANNTLSSSSANGLMSSTDKAKLDNINIANYYTKADSDGRYYTKVDAGNYFVKKTDLATASANGLMSAADKSKLDAYEKRIADLELQMNNIINNGANLKTAVEGSGLSIWLNKDWKVRWYDAGGLVREYIPTQTQSAVNKP